MAASVEPAPNASIIRPRWLIVEYASTRLKSFITSAKVHAYTKVNNPTIATMRRTLSVNWNSGINRATRNTPAVTIVAA